MVTLGVANGTESNGLNRIFANKRNFKKGLGHFFITSRSSHFFSKTDFEQCLFNENAIVTVR